MTANIAPRRSIPPALLAISLALAAACASAGPLGPPATAAGQAEAPAPDPAAWKRPLARPRLPERPLRVAFLVVDGVHDSELTDPWDVLHHVAAAPGEPPALELFTVSPDGAAVTTAAGMQVAADHGFDDAPAPDLLVVPSATAGDAADPVVAWVRRAGGTARWVVALRDGAFLLARAGLLEGRAATTFPDDYDTFARRFPGIELRVNLSFVHDGPALTSQGGARSYDVAMYLVDYLFGEETARRVGRELLLPWPPDPTSPPSFAVVPPPPTAEPAAG